MVNPVMTAPPASIDPRVLYQNLQCVSDPFHQYMEDEMPTPQPYFVSSHNDSDFTTVESSPLQNQNVISNQFQGALVGTQEFNSLSVFDPYINDRSFDQDGTEAPQESSFGDYHTDSYQEGCADECLDACNSPQCDIPDCTASTVDCSEECTLMAPDAVDHCIGGHDSSTPCLGALTKDVIDGALHLTTLSNPEAIHMGHTHLNIAENEEICFNTGMTPFGYQHQHAEHQHQLHNSHIHFTAAQQSQHFHDTSMQYSSPQQFHHSYENSPAVQSFSPNYFQDTSGIGPVQYVTSNIYQQAHFAHNHINPEFYPQASIVHNSFQHAMSSQSMGPAGYSESPSESPTQQQIFSGIAQALPAPTPSLSPPSQVTQTEEIHKCMWTNDDARSVVCGREFASAKVLQEHLMDFHTKPLKKADGFICKWHTCSRGNLAEEKEGFAQRSKLDRHLQSHTGFKACQCEECGKAFSTTQTLESHMRTHTKEKPFACTYEGCEYSAAQASQLTMHVRTKHTRDKPLQCPECGTVFSESSNLSKHRKIHLPEQDCRCTLCCKTFRRQDQLKRHMKTHAKKVAQKEAYSRNQSVATSEHSLSSMEPPQMMPLPHYKLEDLSVPQFRND